MVAVPDAGGEPRPLVDPAASEVRRTLPHMLPGGRAFLLSIIRSHEPQGSLGVRLLESSSDRAGATTPLRHPRRPYYMPRVSPDGQRLAVTIFDEGAYSIWTTDSPGGSMTRRADASLNPVWSPDGSRLAFTSACDGLDLAIMPSDGSPATPVVVDGTYKLPTSWTPDGQFVVFTRNDPAGSTGEDVYIAAADGTGVRALTQSIDNESGGVVSPDGEWLAYVAGGHTKTAIYVAALREPGRRSRVDAEDGYMPMWSRDGGELFFLTGTRRDRLMSVRVSAGANGLRRGRPERLFDQSMGGSAGWGCRITTSPRTAGSCSPQPKRPPPPRRSGSTSTGARTSIA
jgi:Tol biopolymer transport system component